MLLAYAIIIGQQLIPLMLAILCAFFVTNRLKGRPPSRLHVVLWAIVFYIIFWILIVFTERLLFSHLWTGSD